MSINIPQVGSLKNVIRDLTTTDSTTIYTGQNKIRGVLNSMSVCNDSGSAATFTLTITDGTTTVKIYDLKSVAAHDTFLMVEHEIPIPNGWTIAITATTANTLHVVAVIVEQGSTQGTLQV